MKFDSCCTDHEPVLEVLYLDEKYNEGKPIKICKYHWEQTDDDGAKFWQRHTREIKVLA